jgi:hypothetical protein
VGAPAAAVRDPIELHDVEHRSAGDLTDKHVGRYIVIRPEGSEANVMGRLNHVMRVA